MKENHNTTPSGRALLDDPEFIKACEKALQDPEKRKQIICILQRGGLYQSFDRLRA